jgi:hypothetical protein
MTAQIIPFRPRERSRIVLDGGTVDGRPFFLLEYSDADVPPIGVWEGQTYTDALAAAREWQRDGAPLVDLWKVTP